MNRFSLATIGLRHLLIAAGWILFPTVLSAGPETDTDKASYQVQGGVEIQLTRWMWSQLGWRYLKYDYVTGGFTNKTALNGPYVETGVNF